LVRRICAVRKLQPDDALLRRRAAGEPLRDLARDYGVRHTTLSRYFRRPEVVKQLKRADQLNRAERRVAEARWRAEEKAEREARRLAKQQQVAAGKRAPRHALSQLECEARDSGRRPESAPPDEQPDDPGPPIAPESGRVATSPSRHVPPLDLEPFSNDWLAWYTGRRHLSEIDMLNCNDAWRGIVPPLERRARERGRPSIRK
jgi:hypothetical protein